MTEPIIISNQCKLITCDARELKLLREIAQEVEARNHSPFIGKLLEALEPWSKYYAEGEL